MSYCWKYATEKLETYPGHLRDLDRGYRLVSTMTYKNNSNKYKTVLVHQNKLSDEKFCHDLILHSLHGTYAEITDDIDRFIGRHDTDRFRIIRNAFIVQKENRNPTIAYFTKINWEDVLSISLAESKQSCILLDDGNFASIVDISEFIEANTIVQTPLMQTFIQNFSAHEKVDLFSCYQSIIPGNTSQKVYSIFTINQSQFSKQKLICHNVAQTRKSIFNAKPNICQNKWPFDKTMQCFLGDIQISENGNKLTSTLVSRQGYQFAKKISTDIDVITHMAKTDNRRSITWYYA